ncbi:putative sortilin [Toxoplasma gondii RUB]|uniref:Putative sortilin n=1 Tax=Toxoplasma gondii RUB TaxID=935652 RepID=A0A086M1J4_TOXGO|nr:putative sortilin [Toxoplasma gondii RUB]
MEKGFLLGEDESQEVGYRVDAVSCVYPLAFLFCVVPEASTSSLSFTLFALYVSSCMVFWSLLFVFQVALFLAIFSFFLVLCFSSCILRSSCFDLSPFVSLLISSLSWC